MEIVDDEDDAMGEVEEDELGWLKDHEETEESDGEEGKSALDEILGEDLTEGKEPQEHAEELDDTEEESSEEDGFGSE